MSRRSLFWKFQSSLLFVVLLLLLLLMNRLLLLCWMESLGGVDMENCCCISDDDDDSVWWWDDDDSLCSNGRRREGMTDCAFMILLVGFWKWLWMLDLDSWCLVSTNYPVRWINDQRLLSWISFCVERFEECCCSFCLVVSLSWLVSFGRWKKWSKKWWSKKNFAEILHSSVPTVDPTFHAVLSM